jgi:hypothetical protein
VPDGVGIVVPGARHWPLAALLLVSVLWGGAITGTKYALRAFDPVTLLSVELAAATAALWAVLLIRGFRPPPSWRAAVLLGLLEPALAYLPRRNLWPVHDQRYRRRHHLRTRVGAGRHPGRPGAR